MDQIELELDHKESLDHIAKRWADEDIASGEETNWEYAYEQAAHAIEHLDIGEL